MSIELPYAHYDLSITRDLGDGLLLRWSNSEDTEELAYLTSMVFRDSEDAPPNTNLGDLVLEFSEGGTSAHGTTGFCDRRRYAPPSTQDGGLHMLLVGTAWEYEGIHIGLGRPEIVATDPSLIATADWYARCSRRFTHAARHRETWCRGSRVSATFIASLVTNMH